MNKTIVVLGLRSGTSLLMSILDSVGIYTGCKPSFSQHNKNGHFEDSDFKACNDSMLLSIGKNTFNFTVNESELGNIKFSEILKCKELIDKKPNDILAVKNPNFVWTLPIWDSLFNDPHYILCTRDREKQHKSLIKMNMGNDIPNHKEWMDCYWSTAEKYLINKKVLKVDFDMLIDSPELTIDKVLRFVNYHVDDDSFNKALELVDVSERHF